MPCLAISRIDCGSRRGRTSRPARRRDTIRREAGGPGFPGRRALLPDTHAHLDAFGDDLEAVLERAAAAGVVRILAVGTDLKSCDRVVELAQRHASVYAAVGIHPHEAATFERDASQVEEMTRAPRVVAIGEIGLDYYREGANPVLQREIFRTQLRWAQAANLPVSVHCRAAGEDTRVELEAARVATVLHCFSGDMDLLRSAAECGWYVSFAGNVTFPRADTLRDAARAVPLDRLLVESDAPVLAPQPWRGRRNEPAYVTATAGTIAELHHVDRTHFDSSVTGNAARVFGWPA